MFLYFFWKRSWTSLKICFYVVAFLVYLTLCLPSFVWFELMYLLLLWFWCLCLFLLLLWFGFNEVFTFICLVTLWLLSFGVDDARFFFFFDTKETNELKLFFNSVLRTAAIPTFAAFVFVGWLFVLALLTKRSMDLTIAVRLPASQSASHFVLKTCFEPWLLFF